MDTNGYNPSTLPQPVPLPSIHLHPSLSTVSRNHPQPSTRASPHSRPSPITALSLEKELPRLPPSARTSSYRTTTTSSSRSRPSTASSRDEQSEDDNDHDHDEYDGWDRASYSSSKRHHPYHSSRPARPQLSISPSHPLSATTSRRPSLYSPYSRSNDDMCAFVHRAGAGAGGGGRGSAGASANVSADEGSNSTHSYYDGDSSVAGLSPLTTSSPVFTFGNSGQGSTAHGHGPGPGHLPHGHGAPGGVSPNAGAGGPGGGGQSAGTGAGSGAGAGAGAGSSTAPLSLDSLPSYPPDQKPPFSYPVLIRLAILGSPQKKLLLSQIYSAIEEKFPWYKDSAPKAWKASVRHCLSLNKEFVRMQRAVEDPGVGCGGWWSVGEGMKGLKRPRKRRPAQSKRPEHEIDPTPIVKAPIPSPLAIRRRHSSTFDHAVYLDTDPRYVSPLSSHSLPPSATALKPDSHVRPGGGGGKDRAFGMDVVLPPLEDYPLRLPPLHIPSPMQPLPTPPSSSRTVIFGTLGSAPDGNREIKREREREREYSHAHGYPLSSESYTRRRGSHTPTASSSSSYSTQSYGSASSASSNSHTRPNPMSISSLLNDHRGAGSGGGGMADNRLDKMDIDMAELRVADDHEHDVPVPSRTSATKNDRDVEMRPAKVETPFSSDQTLRPPSPRSTSPQSPGGRRSTTPIAPNAELQRRHQGRAGHHHHRRRQHHHERPRASSRPPSRSRTPASGGAGAGAGAIPARPSRPLPPLPMEESENGVMKNVKSAKAGGGARANGWASVMDLSKMDYESESE